MHAISSVVSGDKGSGGELQAARPHGLSDRPLSSHDGLLEERQEQPAQIRGDCQLTGQTHPQSQQPEGSS